MSTRQSERPDAGPNPAPRADIKDICASFGNDRHRMLDILLCVQEAERQISADAIRTIAAATGASPIEVEGVASFYAFLSLSPKGRVTIRLCDDIIDRHAGLAAVQAAFEAGLGIAVGQTSADGAFSLEYTPCIGMCDQAPAAMINDVVVTKLTPGKVAGRSWRGAEGGRTARSADRDALRRSRRPMRRRAPWSTTTSAMPGAFCWAGAREAGLKAALAMTPGAILDCVEASGLAAAAAPAIPPGPSGATRRRRGGAAHRHLQCRRGGAGHLQGPSAPDRTGASDVRGHDHRGPRRRGAEGIIYLRGEYAYLRN
jgi:[NiFe] hydrogenase diaphorase moiety large subunit